MFTTFYRLIKTKKNKSNCQLYYIFGFEDTLWAGQVFIEAVADEMFWWDSALAQCGSRCGSSHLTVFGVFYFERFIFKTADDVTKAASDIQTHMHLLACFTAATVLSLTHPKNITMSVAAEKKKKSVFIKLSLMLHFSANTISIETWEQPLECTPLMWLHMPLPCQLRHAQAFSATWCSHVVKKKRSEVRDVLSPTPVFQHKLNQNIGARMKRQTAQTNQWLERPGPTAV